MFVRCIHLLDFFHLWKFLFTKVPAPKVGVGGRRDYLQISVGTLLFVEYYPPDHKSSKKKSKKISLTVCTTKNWKGLFCTSGEAKITKIMNIAFQFRYFFSQIRRNLVHFDTQMTIECTKYPILLKINLPHMKWNWNCRYFPYEKPKKVEIYHFYTFFSS